ncbi:MAG: hypothetical protein ACKOUD_06525, partial [Rhodoluna sp.]
KDKRIISFGRAAGSSVRITDIDASGAQVSFGASRIGWISPLWHGTDLGRTISYGSPQALWVTAAHWIYLAIWLFVGLNVAYRQTAKRLAA